MNSRQTFIISRQIRSEGVLRACLRAVVRVKGAVPLPMSPVRPTRHNEMTSQHQPYNNEGQPQRLDNSPQPCAMQRLVGSQRKPAGSVRGLPFEPSKQSIAA